MTIETLLAHPKCNASRLEVELMQRAFSGVPSKERANHVAELLRQIATRTPPVPAELLVMLEEAGRQALEQVDVTPILAAAYDIDQVLPPGPAEPNPIDLEPLPTEFGAAPRVGMDGLPYTD